MARRIAILVLAAVLGTGSNLYAQSIDFESLIKGALTGAGGTTTLPLRTLPAFKTKRRAQPKNNKKIELWVYDNTGTNPILDGSTYIEYERSRHPNKVFKTMTSFTEFRDYLRQYKRAGYEIENLKIVGHGRPGKAGFLDATNLGVLKREGLDASFGKGADVDIRSCNTARGVCGAHLLQEIGDNLLAKNGGSVTGANNYYLGLPIVGGSVDGKYLTYSVEPGKQGEFSKRIDLEAQREIMKSRLTYVSGYLARHQRGVRLLGLGDNVQEITRDILTARREVNKKEFDLEQAATAQLWIDSVNEGLRTISWKLEAQARLLPLP